jgi:hypothetical protein
MNLISQSGISLIPCFLYSSFFILLSSFYAFFLLIFLSCVFLFY